MEATADEVLGVLDAGADEENHRRDEFVAGQQVAIGLGVDQRGDEVITRLGPASIDQFTYEFSKRAGTVVRSHELDIVDHRMHRADERVRPLDEFAVVIVRRAEHFADDPDRYVMRNVGHEIAAAVASHLVEQLIDQRVEIRPHALDGPRGECSGDQLAQSGVIGRIDERKHVRKRLECRAVVEALVVAQALRARTLPEARIAQARRDSPHRKSRTTGRARIGRRARSHAARRRRDRDRQGTARP